MKLEMEGDFRYKAQIVLTMSVEEAAWAYREMPTPLNEGYANLYYGLEHALLDQPGNMPGDRVCRTTGQPLHQFAKTPGCINRCCVPDDVYFGKSKKVRHETKARAGKTRRISRGRGNG